jgi:hypothetical protein
MFGGVNPGAPLAYLSILWFVIAIAAGSVVQCFLYMFLMKMRNRKVVQTK